MVQQLVHPTDDWIDDVESYATGKGKINVQHIDSLLEIYDFSYLK